MLGVPIDGLDRCIGELDVLQVKVQETLMISQPSNLLAEHSLESGHAIMIDHGSSQS